MRVALISDIHGNFVALETVLRDLKRVGYDRLVCLGDVAAFGPQPVPTLDALRDLGCPVILGNADDPFLDPAALQADQAHSEQEQRLLDMDLWMLGQLSADHLAFFRQFVPTHRLELEGGRSLLCYHGSPRSNRETILSATPDAELDRVLGGVDADLLAGGHTHRQMFRRHYSRVLINTGSVGLALEKNAQDDRGRNPPWAEYAVVTSNGLDLSVDLRRAALDTQAIISAARASGMPHAEWWAQDWR